MISKKTLLFILCLAFLAILYGVVKIIDDGSGWEWSYGDWIKKGITLTSEPITPCLTSGVGVGEKNLPNIIVAYPTPEKEIGLPLVIYGKARVFENTLNFRLLDENGSVLTEGVVASNAKEAGQYGDFEISTSYPIPKGEFGKLEVFDYSAKDGSIENLVSIKVKFSNIISIP